MTWLDSTLSLSAQAQLEAARRAIPRLHRHDLEARLDSALVQMMTHDQLLRQALARVMELEIAAALSAPADDPAPHHRQWAAELLTDLKAAAVDA